MKIRELVTCTMKLPKKAKERQDGIWNLERNEALRGAIEECLASGKEVFRHKPGGMLYHVRPEYPLIESAMAQPENANLLRVSVTAYMSSEHLGVESAPPESMRKEKQDGNRSLVSALPLV